MQIAMAPARESEAADASAVAPSAAFSSAEWSVGAGVVARSVGSGVLVHAAATTSLFAEALLEAFVEALPPEPERLMVVVNVPVSASAAGLADLVAAAVRPVRSDHLSEIRLVLSDAGAPGPDSPARQLAGRLGIDVVAADGPILLLGPGSAAGSLYVAAVRGQGGWRRFRPDGSTAPEVARRHPAPPWEYDVPARATLLPSGTVLEPIPAGVWMHGPRLGLGLLSDPAFRIAPADDRILLLSGGPDLVIPPRQDIDSVLARLARGAQAARSLVHHVAYDQAC